MDADPWADAPPSPRPRSQHGKPNKATAQSPFVRSSPKFEDAPQPVASSSRQTSPIRDAAPTDGDDLDEFDDFDAPAAVVASKGAEDDGFGDFGRFEEGDFGVAGMEQEQIDAMAENVDKEPHVMQKQWQSLRLQPFPSPPDLLKQLSSLLSPLDASSSTAMTDEPPRQVNPLSQIMVSESSRDAYVQLCTPPMLKALDWTRSRTRREHLISMGVPVNLDEVDSHRLSALPPLRITTGHMGPPRKASLDINGRVTAQQKGKGRDLSPNGVRSSPATTNGVDGNGLDSTRKYGLEAKPGLDVEKAEELCGIEEDQLSLIPLERLRKMQDDLVTTSAQASSVLAWLLQLKDAQTQDSETYNGMISELITNAAKAKSAQTAGSGGVFRRASVRQRPQSASGHATPRRVDSPSLR